jgi:hypothetical protein
MTESSRNALKRYCTTFIIAQRTQVSAPSRMIDHAPGNISFDDGSIDSGTVAGFVISLFHAPLMSSGQAFQNPSVEGRCGPASGAVSRRIFKLRAKMAQLTKKGLSAAARSLWSPGEKLRAANFRRAERQRPRDPQDAFFAPNRAGLRFGGGCLSK